ncbi:hypothetical protein A2V94_02065 [Candidatus Atribacteria bacterium RBG_16_35_8]|nr:MAG: hypothetical protein A2V94_02065 [Candidatus Atribacteria bacterium RBG_16_35_8]
MHNTNRGSESQKWIFNNRITRGIISLVINAYRKINIFIGEPINPIAENILEEFKDFTNPGNYKKVLDNINESLEKEFLDLADEADDLFGTEDESPSGSNFIDDFDENPKKLNP